MIDIEVKLTDKGKNKLYKKSYNNVKSKIIKDVGDDMYKFIVGGGRGVRFLGYSPIGGAPVWEDDPGLLDEDQSVGDLRDSHTKKNTSTTYTIGSTSPYVLDVLFGYRSFFWQKVRGSDPSANPPKENHYHKRTVDETIKNGSIENNFRKAMSEEKLL